MILARIETWSGKWQSLTNEQYADLREHVGLPETKPDFMHEAVWLDHDALMACARHGVTITPAEDSNTNTMLVKLCHRMGGMEVSLAERVAEGSAVTIAIPDIGLLTMRAVTVLTNGCTDILQEYLNKGWRLLAVCPPNGARRPDYVLGHADKDAES